MNKTTQAILDHLLDSINVDAKTRQLIIIAIGEAEMSGYSEANSKVVKMLKESISQ
jgi:hypothetical protein